MKRLCYVLVVFTMLLGTSVFAKEKSKSEPLWGFIDSVWIEYEQSYDCFLPRDWQGEHATNVVNRYGIGAESRSLWIPAEDWAIFGKLQYSDHKANEYPDHGQDSGFKELGAQLGIKKYFFKRLYVGLYTGMAYIDEFPNFENRDWSDRCLESNVGRSHFFGSLGGLIGLKFRIPKTNNWSLASEARFTHSSDPIRTDEGKNLAGVSFLIIREFGQIW
jgi:hypothetical protein